MLNIEEKLQSWTGPSSDSEQEKQERAVRMVREAVQAHSAFNGANIKVFAKGSYANNTNVRADSDVDVAVECMDVCYWAEHTPGAHPPSGSYTGIWTPTKLRAELVSAMRGKFSDDVDTSGSTGIRIRASSARVDADVVPCFDYKYYFSASSFRVGTKIFRKDGSWLVNYPDQQLANGTAKNKRTGLNYKRTVRLLKRIENALNDEGLHKNLPSYFMECLVYNCPDDVLTLPTWTATVRDLLINLYSQLEGPEPNDDASERWLEVSECKYLFHASQSWSRADGRSLAKAAWNYLGFDT